MSLDFLTQIKTRKEQGPVMNKVKLCLWILSLLFQAFVVSANAEPTSQLNLLKDVLVEKNAETLTFRLEFNKPIKKNPLPVFYKKSVQLDFPEAFVIPAKRAITTQDPLIPQIFVVQHDPQTLRVRFVLGEGKHGGKENFHLERKGNGLVIRVDKNPKDVLDKFIAKVKQSKASDDKKPAAPVIAVSKPLPAPIPLASPAPADKEDSPIVVAEGSAQKNKAEPLNESLQEPSAAVQKTVSETKDAASAKVPSNQETPDFLKFKDPVAPEPPSLMASGWKMLYTLALVLALMFFIFYIFKKVVLKNSALGGNDRLVKVLSTGYLGPKKTVALVDVAGEVLVLGISDGNISLLTQIHDEERIDRIRGAKTNVFGKILSPAEGEPMATKSTTEANNNIFNKYIKQFSSQAESVQVSPAASVAELIRKSRGKIKAAS
ncbi:MAG: flagellar biosynthetic protein FliO [Nitrospinae bacterium RIFCSPLOWO2_12_FULL_47_7]|nr:MAG: flagellar biosynthetic protein FliO [Nitrospinae bacterium RIFCSPLOWO2_12_FULL_47_7]